MNQASMKPTFTSCGKAVESLSRQGKAEPYSIVLPPLNANGNLHVGHGLMIPIEDVLIRYARMNGKDTLWVPGADHAGLRTWVVFEKYLENRENQV